MKRRRLRIFVPLILLLAVAGLALAQSAGAGSFTTIRTLGEARPQNIRYNQPLDQLLWVAPGGNLQLVDARSYEVQHTLYTAQTYKAIAFSDDGTFLAVAVDRQVDLWNPVTGELLESFIPEGILDIQGPLQFANDNGLLVVNSVVRAPQEIRRSENDTSVLPWLWDIPNALGTGRSSLPGQASALPFFDYRNGFILGNQDKVVASRPGRLEVLDVGTTERNVVLSQIDSDRFERDPVDAWRSVLGDYMYVLPIGRNLAQIDTSDGSVIQFGDGATIGLGRNPDFTAAMYERFLVNRFAISIGEQVSTDYNSLTARLLGINYREDQGFVPLRVSLVDVLDPLTATAAPNRVLVYVFNEATEVGTFRQLSVPGAVGIAVNPLKTQLAVFGDSGAIDVYDIASGDLIRTIDVAYPNFEGRALFAYDPTGTEILYDFQRFDVSTGEVVLEDLNIRPGFDEFYFSADNRRITTIDYINGDTFHFDWWQWDIETGEVVRQEQVRLRGEWRDVAPDHSRYLLVVNDTVLGEATWGMEIVEVGADDRPVIYFENLPNVLLSEIYPSPDWRHALVTYDFNDGIRRHTDLALYSFENGLEWVISGENVPGGVGGYSWLDNNTIRVQSSAPADDILLPTDLGLAYHPTGLPQCLVDAFPEAYEQWVPIWERRVTFLNTDALNELARDVCDVLPTGAMVVDSIITTPTPSPVPTRESITTFRATQPALAGVPTCITLRFENDALRYAEVWRSISNGLSPEALSDLETIVCEGLQSTGSGAGGGGGEFSRPVMLIDIDTQERLYTFDRPEAPLSSDGSALLLVAQAYERETQSALNSPKLSPNRQLLAHVVGNGYIRIERLGRPYVEIAQAATATQSVFASQTPNIPSISLQPTATPTSELLGLPLPTVTPTITPTGPARADQIAPLPALGDVVDTCDPDAKLMMLANAPSDFSPTGRLYTTQFESGGIWQLDPATGENFVDLTAPQCHMNGTCNLSFDGDWGLVGGETPLIFRPDGTDIRPLLDGVNQTYAIADVQWEPRLNRLVIFFDAPEDEAEPFEIVRFVRTYDPTSDLYTEPFIPPTREPFPQINEIPTNYISTQPDGPYALARQSFPTGRGPGSRYYMVNTDTDEIIYFARLTQTENFSDEIEHRWSQLGLFFRYPDEDIWYLFDPTDAQFYQFVEELPGGTFSRDRSFRYEWRRPDSVEFQERIEAGLPNPHLYVYEIESGRTRRYCIPQMDDSGIQTPLTLSPDNRYLAFTMSLPPPFFETRPTPIPETTPTPFYGLPDTEPVRLSGIQRTFVLDLETGSVVEVGQGQSQILAWIEESYE